MKQRPGRMATLGGALALVLWCGFSAATPVAHASADPCLDSLDVLAGVHYVAADDSASGPLNRSAYCYFDPTDQYTYTFTWGCHGDSMDVTLRTKASLQIHRRQFIRRQPGVSDSLEETPLWRHFQHDRMAVTQDERPVLLAEWLVAHLPPLHARTFCGAHVQGAFADRVVADAVSARLNAVMAVARANSDAIAALTRQGTVPLVDRAAYFNGLYDRAGLVRANFPYLADVESLLVSARYVNAPRPRCDGE